MEFFNYYEILGVAETAGLEAIKNAFRVNALKYHPDRVPDYLKKKSEDIFKMISEAYEVLSDSEKRKKYDEGLKKVKPDQTANQASPNSPPVVNVDKNHFRFENLKPRVLVSEILTVLNQGGDTLIGTISADKPWVKLSETVINTSDYQEIEITVDTGSLPPGFSDSAIIEIDTNGGKKTVTVYISLETDFITIIFSYGLILKSLVSSYWPILKSWLKPFWPRILTGIFLLVLCLICYFYRLPAVNKTSQPEKAVGESPVFFKPEISKPVIPKLEDLEGAWSGYLSPYGNLFLSITAQEDHFEGEIVTAGIIGRVKGEIRETGEIVFKIEDFKDVFKDLARRTADFSEFISTSFTGRLKGDKIESNGKQIFEVSKINGPVNPWLIFNGLFVPIESAKYFTTLDVVYEVDFETVWEAALKVLRRENEKIRFADRKEKIIVTCATEHSSLFGDYFHKYFIIFRNQGRATEVIVKLFRYEKGFGSARYSITSDSTYTTDAYFFIPLEKELTKETERNDFAIQRSYFRKSSLSKAMEWLF